MHEIVQNIAFHKWCTIPTTTTNNNDDDDDYDDEKEKVAVRLDWNLSEIDALLSVARQKCTRMLFFFFPFAGKKNDLRMYMLSVRLFNSADEFIIVCHCFIGIIIRNDVYYNFVK